MKSHLELIPTGDMTYDQWLNYRNTGIGASETGIVLGLSPYKSSIELYYEKIGQGLPRKAQSLSAFLGKGQEEYLADLWEAWDGTEDGMMRNYDTGVKVRRCKRVNAYMRNPKYPHLFVSLDFEINQHSGRGNGALETKTIGEYAAAQWEAGFPPFYVTQLVTQCGVGEYEYGESAILEGNKKFYVLPFEMDEQNKGIFASVVEKTAKFWSNVIEGRKLLTQQFEFTRLAAEAENNHNMARAHELNGEAQAVQNKIYQLEPAPDGSEAYHDFLKEKYKIARPGERQGTPQNFADACKALDLSNRIKELEEAKQLPVNNLKAAMGKESCDRLDFGASGYITWKENAKGTRMFLNKVKP